MSNKWLWLIIGAVVALGLLVGCGKQKPIAEPKKPQYLYSDQSYSQAEQQIEQTVVDVVSEQEAKIEYIMIDWGPAKWDPPRLSARIDAYCDPKAGQAISKVAADACLTALPKHEQVAVTVYWWGGVDASRGFARENLGKWVWSKSGELVEYEPPPFRQAE